jgi:hypothetical protein
MNDDNNWYEARLDKIFSKGALWKHRTFRTILDPYSSEWNHTTMEKKIEILERVVSSGENLVVLVADYKGRYNEQNRHDISNRVEEALTAILQNMLVKRGDE